MCVSISVKIKNHFCHFMTYDKNRKRHDAPQSDRPILLKLEI